MLIHVVTQKGKGYPPAESCRRQISWRGQVRRRSPARSTKAKSNAPSYTAVFAKALIAEAEVDPKIVAITAAMPAGTGLDLFPKRFPTAASMSASPSSTR